MEWFLAVEADSGLSFIGQQRECVPKFAANMRADGLCVITYLTTSAPWAMF
jgi:hypothetical protein